MQFLRFISRPWAPGFSILALLCGLTTGAWAAPGTKPVRGADEVFWVPTLEQALDMAKVTGRPIFVMGYSLVGDGSTYTKKSDDFCTGVF